jgi:hypothetical protein
MAMKVGQAVRHFGLWALRRSLDVDSHVFGLECSGEREKWIRLVCDRQKSTLCIGHPRSDKV